MTLILSRLVPEKERVALPFKVALTNWFIIYNYFKGAISFGCNERIYGRYARISYECHLPFIGRVNFPKQAQYNACTLLIRASYRMLTLILYHDMTDSRRPYFTP